VESLTRELWARQDRHQGDRQRLFAAVADEVDATTVLYPGSFVDVTASFAFPNVTYVDSDRRARQFFADRAGVEEIIDAHRRSNTPEYEFRFAHKDYREDLGFGDETFDLLMSLYAGFVSLSCTRYLRIGGTLLVNSGNRDAPMAAADSRFRLIAVVASDSGRYRVDDRYLDEYFIPKKEQGVTEDRLHRLARGVVYAKTPFAYLFERLS
jgi:SAM-dependent methyltransferase